MTFCEIDCWRLNGLISNKLWQYSRSFTQNFKVNLHQKTLVLNIQECFIFSEYKGLKDFQATPSLKYGKFITKFPWSSLVSYRSCAYTFCFKICYIPNSTGMLTSFEILLNKAFLKGNLPSNHKNEVAYFIMCTVPDQATSIWYCLQMFNFNSINLVHMKTIF